MCLLYDPACGERKTYEAVDSVEDDGTGQVCFAAAEGYADLSALLTQLTTHLARPPVCRATALQLRRWRRLSRSHLRETPGGR